MKKKTSTDIAQFETFLRRRGLKFTHERKVLFDEVSRLRGHFNADSLYDGLQAQGLRIARDTVYRTLPLLFESGIIQKSVGETKREHFERAQPGSHHDHLVCLGCGKVVEFNDPELERFQAKVAGRYGFELTSHEHRLLGYCPVCSKKGNNG